MLSGIIKQFPNSRFQTEGTLSHYLAGHFHRDICVGISLGDLAGRTLHHGCDIHWLQLRSEVHILT